MPSPKTNLQTTPPTTQFRPWEAQDAHELLLLIAWRNARRERSVGWYYNFSMTVAGLPKVTHVLQVSDLLSRDDLAAVLAAAGHPQNSG